ncbi:MAG: response regulator transcription factor [Treponema sp.]|jgi:NarL family two-component system response regulator LiaR|nr:response regulator transcription factor [Treponema sp.]
MINIALIDDHPLAASGIGAWLCATGRFAIAGTARTLNEAGNLMEKLNPLPEIVILDVSLGTEDGFDFIPALEDICAQKGVERPCILVCSMYEDPFLIQRALDSGANAYVAKCAESEEIITAIDKILAGDLYVNPKYQIQTPKRAWQMLTSRENEIVSLIKQSLSSRQIAKRLGISIRTVENHLAHIYEKTETCSREELLEL